MNLEHELLKLLPDIKFAALFGSRATGKARAKSDYDIAIFTTKALSFDQRFELQQLFAGFYDVETELIDIADVYYMSPVGKMEVTKNGVIISDMFADAFMNFKIAARHEYIETERFRKYQRDRIMATINSLV
jgi:predicted nucleotidyltransferase